MGVLDFGQSSDRLNQPSLSQWAASVAAVLGSDIPVETRYGAQTGALAPRTGWADFGTTYAGLYVTKQARVVTIDAMLKPVSDTAMTIAPIIIADVPTWAKPARQQIAAGVLALAASQYPLPCRITVQQADGAVILYAGAAGTITAAGGWVAVCMSYRSAT